MAYRITRNGFIEWLLSSEDKKKIDDVVAEKSDRRLATCYQDIRYNPSEGYTGEFPSYIRLADGRVLKEVKPSRNILVDRVGD